MASRIFSRSFFYKSLPFSLLPRSSPSSIPTPPLIISRPSLPSFSLLRFRPISSSSAAGNLTPSIGSRCFSTHQTSSSLNDPSPNWSNRPPKETILLDGCDFEHWLVVLEKPEGDPTRDEIIDSYIKTLAMVVGSEEEARMKIYSVSTRCYYAFGALVSEELSYKLKELPKVRWVLPDSYLDVRNKDYGGEPFIDGQAVPYDPKYHEEWIRNNNRANERNRRNDRPRNFDRSRNFERRRQNMNDGPPGMGGMQQPNNMPPRAPGMGGMQQPNNLPPAGPGMAQMQQPSTMPPSAPGMGRMQQPNAMPPMHNSNAPPMHNSAAGMGGMQPPNNMPPMHNRGAPPVQNSTPGIGGIQQPNSYPGMPVNNTSNMHPMQNSVPNMSNTGGLPQSNNSGLQFNRNPGTNNMGGMAHNMGGMPQNNMRGMLPPNAGWSNSPQGNMPGSQTNPGWSGNMTSPSAGNMPNFQSRDAPNGGNMSYGSMEMNNPAPDQGFQNNYSPAGNMPSGGNPYDA